MSDFHLPPFAPIYPIRKVVRPRVRGSRRPAWGIEQRATVGLNQTSPEWDVQWLLPFTDANTLDTFLATRAAQNEWFLWTPPNGVQGYNPGHRPMGYRGTTDAMTGRRPSVITKSSSSELG